MVDRPWISAQPARGQAAPTTSPQVLAEPATALAMSCPLVELSVNPEFADCALCHGTGTMVWTQMCADGVLRELSHPCIEDGHASGWYRSVDAADRVVDLIDAAELDV